MPIQCRQLIALGMLSIGIASGPASATLISPTSYDTVNGNIGSFTYFDDTYSGSGDPTAQGSPLTGGAGQLTDGVISNQNWCEVESTFTGGVCSSQDADVLGPYVGWVNVNPEITFHFAAGTNIDRVTIFADDGPDGFGGVSAPLSFLIGGVSYLGGDINGTSPDTFIIDIAAAPLDTLEIKVFRDTSWLFISEIQFEDLSGTVPVPGTLLLFGLGLAGLGCSKRKKA